MVHSSDHQYGKNSKSSGSSKNSKSSKSSKSSKNNEHKHSHNSEHKHGAIRKDTSKSSKAWLKEHFSDVYVQRARQEGVRARSAYKLSEINERHKIIQSGMTVVDLGAAPGSWSEYAAKIVGVTGKVIAMDILPIVPFETEAARKMNNVTYLQGDFTQPAVVDDLLQLLERAASVTPVTHGSGVNVVLSDMAPNTSGIKSVDQMRSLELVYSAANFARRVLLIKGAFLAKVFQCQEVVELVKELRTCFGEVRTVKPEASRARSCEVFLLAKNFINKIK